MKEALFRTSVILSLIGLAGCLDKDSAALMLAKDMCSCHFVVGQSFSHCYHAESYVLLVGNVTVDETLKEATGISNDGSERATFRYVSDRVGCKLRAN